MNKQIFTELIENLQGDDFRDYVNELLESESFTSEQITLLITKMAFTENFEEIEYFGFVAFKNLVNQSDISESDISLIADSVFAMDSESEEWSSTWLDGFADDEIAELRLVIKLLEKKINDVEKAKQLSLIAKNINNRKSFFPQDWEQLEILLKVARSKKTSVSVLKNLVTDPRVPIRLALAENISTPRSALEILAMDSNKKIAEKAKIRLAQ